MANYKKLKNRTVVMRSDPNFKKFVEEIRKKRIMLGKDKVLKPTTTSRITLAMTRHKDFMRIADDIVRADLK